MDSATAKFEQALPLVILPISTQLAALHSSRTSEQSTTLYSCAKCGSDLTTCSTRLARSKRSSGRTLTTTCYACGEITSIPIGTGNANQFPSYKKASQVLKRQVVQAPVVQPIPQPPTLHTSASPAPVKPPPKASTNPPVSANTKPKKKSGLQQMLQRNREMVQKQTKAEAKPAGLSDFLSTL